MESYPRFFCQTVTSQKRFLYVLRLAQQFVLKVLTHYFYIKIRSLSTIDHNNTSFKNQIRKTLNNVFKMVFPRSCPSQSVHIHCKHTILAHLFFRDFSFPILILSSSFSLSHTPHSLSPTISHPLTSPSLSLSHTLLISLSLSLPLLSFFLSLRFFPPFSFFPYKTIQPL